MISNPFNPMPEPPDMDDSTVSRSPSAGKTSAAEQGLEVPMGWKATAKEPVPVVRCTATSTTSGERCKRWSIRGATVCQTHGGRLPNVVEHANAVVESSRMRLMGLTEQAVDVLEDLLQPGTSDAIRIKAVENVLNRAGIRDAIDVHVEHTAVSAAEEISKKLSLIKGRLTPAQPEEEILEAEEVTEES